MYSIVKVHPDASQGGHCCKFQTERQAEVQ
jgi:hypothetical protein